MENNRQEKLESQNLVLELCFRMSFKDYKIRLTTKRAWLISLILLLVRLWASLGDNGSP